MTHLKIIDFNELNKKMSQHFNLTELETLCLCCEIEYEDIPGDTRSKKVEALIKYCERKEIKDRLLFGLKNERPNTNWEIYFKEITTPKPVPSKIGIESQPQTENKQDEKIPRDPQKTQKWWILIVIISLVTVVVMGFTVVYFNNEPPASTPIPPTTTSVPILLKDSIVEIFVTTGSNPPEKVLTNQPIIVPPNDAILLEVIIIADSSSHTPEPVDNYEYSYDTLFDGISENESDSEVLYVAPKTENLDIVSIKIINPSTGEEILRTLPIEVQVNQP